MPTWTPNDFHPMWKSSISAKREDWLLRMPDLQPGHTIFIYPRGDLTAQGALDALKAQGFDPDAFNAFTHGNSLRIHRFGERKAHA